MIFPFFRLGCLGRRIRGRETPWAFPGPRCHQYKLHLFLPETGLERRTLRVKIGGPALSHQLDHGERFRNTIIFLRIIAQPRVTSKTPKTRLCINNSNYATIDRVAKTTTLHERKVLFTFILCLFWCVVLFFALFGVGIWLV